MLWDQNRSQETAYMDRTFYGDYSMQMKAQKAAREEIQRFHECGRVNTSNSLCRKVEKLGESINKSTRHLEDFNTKAEGGNLGAIAGRFAARQHGVAAAVAK